MDVGTSSRTVPVCDARPESWRPCNTDVVIGVISFKIVPGCTDFMLHTLELRSAHLNCCGYEAGAARSRRNLRQASRRLLLIRHADAQDYR